MDREPLGPLLPPPEEEPQWWDAPHPGMVLRLAELDAHGNVVKETFKRVPPGKTLEEAMAWAQEQYRESS